MTVSSVDVEKVLPLYHKEEKLRHDILCLALSEKDELKAYAVKQISEIVLYIEDLVADSVGVAQDELYGILSKEAVKDSIRQRSISDRDEVIDILYERASYYARR